MKQSETLYQIFIQIIAGGDASLLSPSQQHMLRVAAQIAHNYYNNRE